MRLLILVAAMLAGCSVMAAEAPPSFDPNSVPERLRALEGRTAIIKIPSEDDAPLRAAQGAVLSGGVPVQIVTPENTTSIPLELALREREFDRFFLGYVSEAELAAFMEKQSSARIVMLKHGDAVRIIAPGVNDGFATQVLPLTGEWSEPKLGGEVHVWVSLCFLTFTSAADQELLRRGKQCR